jgi:hypothetical protein
MRKLTVLAALKHMFQSIANGWRVAARFSFPWLVLLAVLTGWDFLSGPVSASPENFRPATFVLLVAAFMATSSISVSWNRYILLDEDQSSVKPFRFDKYVRAYLWQNLSIAALGIIPLIIVALTFKNLSPILMPIWIGLSLLIVTVMVRLTVCLPAIAIGRTDFGLQSALTATTGNMLGIFGLIAANTLVIFGILEVSQVINSVLAPFSPALAIPAALVLSMPFQFLVVMLSVTLQTSLYGFFAEGRDF